MTKSEKLEFLDLIKQALNSDENRDLIKQATLEALKSKEGEEIFSEYFRDGFHEVVAPILERHDKRIGYLEGQILKN